MNMKRATKAEPHPLDIPPFLKISAEDRRKAWEANPPKPFSMLDAQRPAAHMPVDPDRVRAEALKATLADQKKRAAFEKLKQLPRKVKPGKDGLARDMQERLPDLAAVVAFGKLNGVWKDEYEKLNPGQQRMLIGNRLRGLLKKNPKLVVKW